MRLNELLGEELYKQVQAAIDAKNGSETDKTKHIRYADLSEGGYISKDKYASLEQELTSANGLIAQMKKAAASDEDLQKKISAYEQQIDQLKADNLKLQTENALKMALKDAGAVDVDYLIYKAKEHGEIKLDDSGRIKGIDSLIGGLKASMPTQFAAEGSGDGARIIEENRLPDGNANTGMTRKDIISKPYSERVKMFQSDPDAFNKAMSET